MNFVKKTKRTTGGHRLALKVLEAPQQTEPAMYLKLTLYWRNECVFSVLGVLGRSLLKSISVACFSIELGL